jgi:hypothetical protein
MTQSATVCIDRNWRGQWEVGLDELTEQQRCATLDEARRVAHQMAAGRRPCELVVRDAYHRVIGRELIEGGVDRTGG